MCFKKMSKILLMLLFLSLQTIAQFKVVFVARTEDANNSTWLSKIKTDWKATGICLRGLWGDIETSRGTYSWTSFDSAIDALLLKNLDIYIRVSMGFKKPSWVAAGQQSLIDSDFQIKSDGNKYIYPGGDPFRMYPLNFTSTRSKDYMKSFFTAVMNHIVTETNPGGKWANKKNSFKEFVPSFSPEEETEYPYDTMCGYSDPEQAAFRQYLQSIYSNDINILKNKWGSGSPSITDWASINPRSYYWEDNNNGNDVYPKGRTDWINFRTTQLSSFINLLASEAHTLGFNIGVNFGSIYDSAIEKRGWIEPTLLIQNVDAVHVADIPMYHESFNFGGDYLRSICKFWTKKNNRNSNPVKFTTEINWPGYTDGGDHTGQNYWDDQLNSYYNKGAHEVYLYGWWLHDATQLETDKTTYIDLYNSINNHVNQAVQTPIYNYAVHLGCEQVLQNHNVQVSGSEKFTIHNSVLEKWPYAPNGFNYHEEKDIVTNKMIAIWPDYLNDYDTQKSISLINKNTNIDGICFTEGSKHITDTAYVKLMKSSISTLFRNATWYLDGSHGEFAHTQGLFNEYNEKRSPLHLIWRARPDLITIWPDANIPAPGSGHTEDFINWSYNNGCGYTNSYYREYPDWEILDNGTPRKYIYDKNIRAVWDSRSDLQAVFLASSPYLAHYSTTPNWNMISWSKSNGYSESSLLLGYNTWPYIGDNRSFYKVAAVNELNNNSSITISDAIDNYPNPFNPSTAISYSIKNKSHVIINIYNVLGEKIASLVDDVKESGNYKITFNGTKFSSGVYIYTLQTNSRMISKKMLLMK